MENDEKDQAELDRTSHGVLGNIDPSPSAKDHVGGVSNTEESGEAEESMPGGSRHDRAEHSDSRGGDIGNRPE